MVGFRNIVVHEYESVNLDVLKNIVQYHLVDIETFYTTILTHYKQDS